MESDDPEVKHIIEGMKKLIQEELKDIITVKVDGVPTEVSNIYVVVRGVNKNVFIIYYNSFINRLLCFRSFMMRMD